MGILRQRLADRVADELRRRICAGGYGAELPGEAELAADLSVSRTVLRDGMAVLCAEGLLKKHKGRRTEVCRRMLARSGRVARRVVLLIGSRSMSSHAYASRVLLLLHSELLLKDFEIEWVVDGESTMRKLDRTVASRPERIWILYGVSRECQQFFVKQHIPAVVLGTCHEDVSLPSVDADYAAIAFHATGLLRQHGYRRLLLVCPETMLGGDKVSLTAFRESTAKAGPSLEILTSSGGRHLKNALKEWVTSAATRGCIAVLRSTTAIAALTGLLGSGLRVPDDVGLISRDVNTAFAGVFPAVCHYEADILRVARGMARIVNKLSVGTSGKIHDFRVIPEFRPGETI